MIQKHKATITTTSGGAATVYSGLIRGKLVAVHYEPGTILTGGDLTITSETTGLSLLTVTDAGTSDVTWYPLALACQTDTTAYTDTGVEMPLYDERIKCVVAQGGDTKTGTITFFTCE